MRDERAEPGGTWWLNEGGFMRLANANALTFSAAQQDRPRGGEILPFSCFDFQIALAS